MRFAVTAGVVAAALALGWLLVPASPAAPALKVEPRAKWEYKVLSLRNVDTAADWEKALTELGADGWEVVGAPSVGVQAPAAGGGVANFPGVRVLLKRPK